MSDLVLDRITDVPWAPVPNLVEVLSGSPGAAVPVTAAHVVVLSPAGVLLTRVAARGWDVCGGHVEEGESVLDAARREVLEEAGVHVGDLEVLGHVQLTVSAPRPDGYRYPYPVSTQQVLLSRLSVVPVPAPGPGTECLEAEWVPVPEALRRCPAAPWSRLLLAAAR